MKKTIITTAFTLILSAMLCGCGTANDMDNMTPNPMPSPTATLMPSIMPDADNGIVDGAVGDGVEILPKPSSNVTDNAAASPNVSTEPTATA